MSFLDKVAAIRSELGLEPKEELATPAAMMAAMTFMGIVPEPSWALPQKVEALVDALGLTFGENSAAAAQGVAAATTSPPSRSWRKQGVEKAARSQQQLVLDTRQHLWQAQCFSSFCGGAVGEQAAKVDQDGGHHKAVHDQGAAGEILGSAGRW